MTMRHLPPDVSMIPQRAAMLRELRSFFDERGFFEVQPPCLSRHVVVDPYIDPIAVDAKQLSLAESVSEPPPGCFYLQTSPELAMKRMVAAGAPSIYSIGPVFRSGECGDQHNVEFTMLEWYDVGADGEAEIRLLGELAMAMLKLDRYDVRTYRQVFQTELNFDPIDASIDTLVDHVRAIDRHFADSIAGDRDLMLDAIFSHSIQPKLGTTNPVIVRDYPITQAALARPSVDDEACAIRFELFFQGVELANGYDELLDADVLIQRAQLNNEIRRATGRQTLRVENALTAAMRSGLPACAGVALGVDRLMMIRTGETSLARIIPLGIDRA